MSRRPRDYIPYPERYAAALACLLPDDAFKELRERKVPAKQIERMFTLDHGALHTFGGADKWWNLTPRLRGPELKAKDNRDTGIAAKAARIDKKWSEFTSKVLAKPKKIEKKYRWPKRSFTKRKK